MMEGSIAAAGQVRDATLQAAKLHMAATIIHQMSCDAARQIEQGLTLRYWFAEVIGHTTQMVTGLRLDEIGESLCCETDTEIGG
jgi:hypothetical protein